MKSLKTLFLTVALSQSLACVAAASSFSVKAWTEELGQVLESEPKKISQALSTKKWSAIQSEALKSSSKEAEILLKARKLFAAEKFDQALALYEQIPRGHDYWLEAVEEKGWAYHRQKNYSKALAQTKTLLSQAFTPIVGSEPFFLQSLSQLKICNYKGILETHELFKQTQRQRLVDLKHLEEKGESPVIEALIAKSESFPLDFTQVGEVAKALPRLFYRDHRLQKALMTIKMSQAALSEIEKRPSSKVSATQIRNLHKANAKARSQLIRRLKVLAGIENQENFKMVQKLNLIEVETIQRIYADQSLDQETYKKGQFAQVSDDQLIFPDDGHPWIDELDKYQVRVNACPQNIRRKL